MDAPSGEIYLPKASTSQYLIVFNFNILTLVVSEILGGPKIPYFQGRFYVGAGGAQAPQMLARPPPPNILVLTAKIRIVQI